ncbi:helix-turn-helix domain-containing protein [Stenotrophomonas maltophilia]|nr:helix-turn-helix domain-containing protein [Stenotrophomonas maltophilia]
MSAVNELLDNVKNRLNLGSDIALAERVGVTRSLISRWRKGDTPLSDERIAQICAMAKIDGATWMAMIHAERATSTTERALWRLILDRVSAAAAVLVLVVFSAPGVARAKSLDIQSFSASGNDSMYIMF